MLCSPAEIDQAAPSNAPDRSLWLSDGAFVVEVTVHTAKLHNAHISPAAKLIASFLPEVSTPLRAKLKQLLALHGSDHPDRPNCTATWAAFLCLKRFDEAGIYPEVRTSVEHGVCLDFSGAFEIELLNEGGFMGVCRLAGSDLEVFGDDTHTRAEVCELLIKQVHRALRSWA